MTRFGLPIIATVIAIPVFATPVWASDSIEIREWEVPYEYTRPRDPHTKDGKLIWFVGQGGDYLGRFDVATERLDRFEQPVSHCSSCVTSWCDGGRGRF